jgi:transcription initiation factor TFIIH subunit 4
MSIVPEPPVPRAYALSPTFSQSLKNALTGGGSQNSFGVPVDPPPSAERRTVADLDDHARTQWENMLFYIVGNTGVGIRGGSEIERGTKVLLQEGKFVMERGPRVTITREGFTFLLQDANVQVWNLLIVYLEYGEHLGMDPVEMLSFLFMLGSLELGKAYSIKALTQTQSQMLEDLADYGLVSKHDGYFYPTRLATTLTSDASALLPQTRGNISSSSSTTPGGAAITATQTPASKGYIILETNHRLYAYTDSVLQIAILNLFTSLKTRFPNLVTGKLTKESIQRAISYGITADQIISYITTHAHPQMHKSTPILPPTVVDQIRLWQIEGDRMKATPGFLMKSFGSRKEYDEIWRYADQLGVLVWKSDAKGMFFVSRLEQVHNFIRQRQIRAAHAEQKGEGSGM